MKNEAICRQDAIWSLLCHTIHTKYDLKVPSVEPVRLLA